MRNAFTPVHAALLRALRGRLHADPVLAEWLTCHGPGSLTVDGFDARRWASLTFEGHRHALMLRLRGPQRAVETAIDRIEHVLEQADMHVSGHFIVEVAIAEMEACHAYDGLDATLKLEALTVID